MVSGVSSLCQVVSGMWCLCREKYFQIILILASVLFVLYREALVVRRLPRMQEVVSSNPTESKICFSHFTLFRVECKELFCKTIKIFTVLTRENEISKKPLIDSIGSLKPSSITLIPRNFWSYPNGWQPCGSSS